MNAENFNDFLNIFTHKESANGKDKKIILPSDIKEIRQGTIKNGYYLKSVIIPEGTTIIGSNAFYNCKSLKSITIPDSVTDIGHSAFEGCTSLTSIAIPKSVTTIGGRAFEGCASLTNINVSEGNNNFCSIDGVLFNKEQTKIICYPPKKPGESYTIPNSITSVADLAFSRCQSLTNIIISNGVTRIGWGTFFGCESLKSITIPESVIAINNCAFDACTSLTSVTIDNSVTRIGIAAFFGCKSLKSVTIPDSVTCIGQNAFNACSSGLTIYGKNGSYAEEYAKENNIKFKGSLKE